jgi:hypothetical protein
MENPDQMQLTQPIPKRMRTLECDARGYPIPVIVVRDQQGTPLFTVNDHTKVIACFSKRLCSICGKRLDADVWIVGGSRAFLHDQGAFIDPPLHHECATYALQVCPFLAAPTYTRSVSPRKIGHLPDGMRAVNIEHSGPIQPERFGLGSTRSYRLVRTGVASVIMIVDRWDYIEWWRNGIPCAAPDAQRVSEIRREVVG